MFEDPNAGGGVTSDPPVGTGGTKSVPTDETDDGAPVEDVEGFEEPATSDPPVGTGGVMSDPPVGTGG